MKHLRSVLMLSALLLFSLGDSGAVLPVERIGSDQSLSCVQSTESGASGEVLAQPACCQGNKGVCGCRAGKIVCCDRTFSSCGC